MPKKAKLKLRRETPKMRKTSKIVADRLVKGEQKEAEERVGMKAVADWFVKGEQIGAEIESVRRVSEGQKKLEALTDDELMQLDARLFVEDFKPGELPLIAHQFADAARCYDLLEEYDRTGTLMPWSNPGVLFLAAVYREVDRRARAACSPWRRWRKPGECKKWLGHVRLIEEKGRHVREGILGDSVKEK
jgi:hypothetical protein